jgi:hypothetical protein
MSNIGQPANRQYRPRLVRTFLILLAGTIFGAVALLLNLVRIHSTSSRAFGGPISSNPVSHAPIIPEPGKGHPVCPSCTYCGNNSINQDFPSHLAIQCEAILNLFTSCIDSTKDQRKIHAQLEVLRSYQRLKSVGVQTWLFTESEEMASQAKEFGVHVVSKFDKTGQGTPCLFFMYEYVHNVTKSRCANLHGLIFDAYTNCDIIFTQNLVRTLEEIRRMWQSSIAEGARKGVMVTGKRTNVDFHSEVLLNDNDVANLSKRGKLYYHFAQDYFIYSRGSRDWNRMPHFVVGRRAYDNWLVTDAHIDKDLDLVDGTNSILALHLTSADGNSAGHHKLLDNDHNVHAFNPVTQKSVGPEEWNHGSTDDAHFFTVVKNGSIHFVKRTFKAGNRTLPSV